MGRLRMLLPTPAALLALGALGLFGTVMMVSDAPRQVQAWRRAWPPLLLWSALCAAGVAALVAQVRRDRRESRTRLGQCVRCGYDLIGNVSGVCPECGEAVVRT